MDANIRYEHPECSAEHCTDPHCPYMHSGAWYAGAQGPFKTRDEAIKAATAQADCGCWYHAEQGLPCRHDMELVTRGPKSLSPRQEQGE